MAYWLGKRSNYGRGNLLHRTSNDDGACWSAPETVDATGKAVCPRMAAGAEGVVYLVWGRWAEEQVIPIWNKYENGVWHSAQVLSVRVGADVWYAPTELVAKR
jgi:hypothetical protein